jgi:hypothetical protein
MDHEDYDANYFDNGEGDDDEGGDEGGGGGAFFFCIVFPIFSVSRLPHSLTSATPLLPPGHIWCFFLGIDEAQGICLPEGQDWGYDPEECLAYRISDRTSGGDAADAYR